ncbi:TIGR02587 family membrane protein [Gloeocapsopsis crepidinum LEGE 06123]|uniref:TIGR02587 family membrane protein n=1 Tax=Gloeocapsopsis crepidinum LEGE 06123 TaxID=588587 RepID=A0ABR9UYX0_9CHRO|nr:TIGR02587 family membrane protein [Gloeocapsopsis crepidinum]MBE9193517.1 TIGR02587 family membrane protein [Gloeocapsopsis crepidinum LEGE 06123]
MTNDNTAKHPRKKVWLSECDDLMRGASGGFLFGIPLLYTMEVWQIGSTAEPSEMLVVLAVTFIIIFLINRTAGFRKSQGDSPLQAAMDSVEAIAIGLVCSAGILILLRRITLETTLSAALGKTIFESVPFAIGVAVANEFISGERKDKSGSKQDKAKQQNQDQLNATIADLGATLIGALFIAFNIAPTDEIPMLSSAISAPWLLAIAIASLLISYGIVFEAGFVNQQKRQQQRGLFQHPWSETIACYLVSIVASVLMLYFFHQLRLNDPWFMWLSYTILLSLPSTIGGAAGRLAI